MKKIIITMNWLSKHFGKNKKLLIKSIIYRVSSVSITFLISLELTKNIEISTIIGITDSLFKIFYYYYFELTWNKINDKNYKSCVVWMTGLSGSGKTTISNSLQKKIKNSIILDGDEIRNCFKNDLFDKESRIKHNINVGYIASILEKQGYVVIVSLVSPFSEAREKCRSFCNKFIEVYISTPLDICEIRDVKGLYLKARNGEIKEFTGIDSPFEVPLNPELVLNTGNEKLDVCVNKIIEKI